MCVCVCVCVCGGMVLAPIHKPEKLFEAMCDLILLARTEKTEATTFFLELGLKVESY